MTKLSVLAFFLMVLPALALGEVSESRDLTGFSQIQVEGNINVEIENSDQFSLVVTVDEGDVSGLVTRLRGRNSETLVLDIDDEKTAEGFSAQISMPDLRAIDMEGSGRVEVGDFDLDDFSVSLLGSGEIITGDISATDVDLSLTGSGDIQFNKLGASTLSAKIAGSGDIILRALEAAKMSAKIAGSGDISADGRIEDLNVSIAGSGDFNGAGLSVDKLSGVVAGSGEIEIDEVSQSDISSVGPDSDLAALGFDLGSITDHLDIEFDDEELRHWSHNNEGPGQGEWLIGFTAVILSLGMPIIIVALVVTYKYRKRRLQYETLRELAASGQPIPEKVVEALSNEQTPKTSLQSGINLVAVGLGIAVFFSVLGAQEIAAVGCIPGFVGIAKILAWKLEQK